MEETIKELKAENERVQLRAYRWQQEYSQLKQEYSQLKQEHEHLLSEHKHLTDDKQREEEDNVNYKRNV